MIKCRKSILSELILPIFIFLSFIFTPLNVHTFSITSFLQFLNDYWRVFSLALYFSLRFLTSSTVDFQFSVLNFLSFIISSLLRSLLAAFIFSCIRFFRYWSVFLFISSLPILPQPVLLPRFLLLLIHCFTCFSVSMLKEHVGALCQLSPH